MTIEVSNQVLADELCEALTSMGCTAVRSGERWVEVVGGWPLHEDSGPRHLDSYLHAWQVRNSGWAVRVNC